MLENVINLLKKEEVDYEFEDNKEAEIVDFQVKLSYGLVNCEFSYEKETGYIRFYSELMEFEITGTEDALELEDNINADSIFLKAYLDDDLVLCIEYYLKGVTLTEELVSDILDEFVELDEKVKDYV